MATREEQVTACLQQLAADLAASHQPLKAVKCLEAALRQAPLPALEAQTRLQIATLLLEHTDCLHQAKDHLLKAEQRLSRVPGEQLLKCEVASALAAAHQHSQQAQGYQQQALEAGLRLTLADPAVLGSSQQPDWTCHFLLRLASCAESRARALQLAEQGAELAQHHGLLQEQVLFLLLQLQLHTAAWQREAAEAALAALEPLSEQLQQPGAVGSSALALRLLMHHKLLQALFLLRLGRYTELHLKLGPQTQPSDHGSNLLPALDALLARVQESEQQQQQQQQQPPRAAYEWLPLPLLGPLVALLWAHVLKAHGDAGGARDRLATGLGAVQQHITQLRAARHQPLHAAAASLRPALVLQLLLRDCQVQVLLLQTDYSAAQDGVAANIAALEAHPAALDGFEALVHYEAGLLGLAVDDSSAAAHQFLAAAQQAEPLLFQPACRAFAALALLSQGAPAAVAQAVELLGDSYGATQAALGYSERALTGLVAGLARLRGGELLEAKARLGQALGLTYKQLANNQLVSQVLTLMAPTQVSPEVGMDRKGAQDMVKTAVILSRSAGDVRSLTSTMRVTQQVLARAGEAQSVAALQNENYLAKKQQELSRQLQAAGADEQTQRRVLRWRLS